MKIQTNAGEVELTAGMVRPGMVWAHARHRLTVLGANARVERPDGSTFTERLGGESPADMGWTLVGCDPAIAAREDVERYGVAPGIDAGAHGFARLRGGGAVDLRREQVPGTVFVDGAARRATAPDGVEFRRGERLVGLDMRYARPEDVERLCCGEHQTEQILDGYVGRTSTGDVCTLAVSDHDTHEDIATGRRWPAKVTPPGAAKWALSAAEAGIVSVARLRAQLGIPAPRAEEVPTFRIDTDVAAPSYVKEQARAVEALMQREIERVAHRASPADAVPVKPDTAALAGRMSNQAGPFDMRKAVETAAGNGFRVDGRGVGDHIPPAGTLTIGEWLAAITIQCLSVTTDRVGAAKVEFDLAPACTASVLADLRRWADASATCVLCAHGQTLRMRPKRISRRTLPDLSADRFTVDLEEIDKDPKRAMSEAAEQLIHCPQCGAPADPGQGVWCSAKCRDKHAVESADVRRSLAAIGEAAKRRATEEPLVALVAAVPKGLDPVGWRAAVLAVHEGYRDDPKTGLAVAGHLASVLLGDCEATSVTLQGACAAYARAVAPQGPRPVPERRRAPGLPLDMDD